jgi:hypothetical protein
MARKCLFLCNREVPRFVDVNGVVLHIYRGTYQTSADVQYSFRISAAYVRLVAMPTGSGLAASSYEA